MLNKLFFKIFIEPKLKKLNNIIVDYIDYDIIKFNEINNMFFCSDICLYKINYKIDIFFLGSSTKPMIFFKFQYYNNHNLKEYVCQIQNFEKEIPKYFEQLEDIFNYYTIPFKDMLLLNKKIKFLSNYIQTYIENDKDIILDYFDFKL